MKAMTTTYRPPVGRSNADWTQVTTNYSSRPRRHVHVSLFLGDDGRAHVVGFLSGVDDQAVDMLSTDDVAPSALVQGF